MFAIGREACSDLAYRLTGRRCCCDGLACGSGYSGCRDVRPKYERAGNIVK
jgi:hypothetical protein